MDLIINGETRAVTADPTANLLDVLRGELGLTGPRFGCGAGQCGSCSVLVDGQDVAACLVEVGNLAGKAIVTVEGLGTPDAPHPADRLPGASGRPVRLLPVGHPGGGQGPAGPQPQSHPQGGRAGPGLAPLPLRVHNRVMDAVLLAAKRMNAETAR
uniref:2Fe-2S iron-sulfur cluster binding domain-containing protein n=1 Tax=Phenylobacterium glaciei TaxID=2803784 RepID=A0A974SA37_9CAUL|nr:2Fe-2S iron-sulfur cluster binding domain-containing protein [Phenylobacterium glaciei]